MYRIYLWFLGVPKDRAIGEWWWIEQPSLIAAQLFLSDCAPFLYAYSIVHESKLDPLEYFIKPPVGSTIIYPNKTVEKWETV